MSPVHGTPEGYERGCTDVLTCPATHVHGLSCQTAYVRFATGERRYMQLVGRNARPAQIAKALGITPQSAVAKELEDMPAHRVPAALAKAERATELALRIAHPAVFAAADDLLEAELAARGQFNPEPAPEPAPIPEESPMTVIEEAPVDRAAVRLWARSHDIAIGVKGRIPQVVIDAYTADDPSLAGKWFQPKPKPRKPRTVKVAEEFAAEVAEVEVLAALNAEADGEPDLPEPAPEFEAVRLPAWNEIAGHPFFRDCYGTDGTLLDAMIAKLDDTSQIAAERDKAVGLLNSIAIPATAPDLRATFASVSAALEFALTQWALASDRASAAEYTAAMLTAHVQHLTDKVNAQGRELADRRRGWFR